MNYFISLSMQESYLHYLFTTKSLGNSFTTTENKKLTILDFGVANSNAGPDFLAARIQLNDEVWAGNIEFHIKSSDWYAHKHDKDPAYDNVIAHFVLSHDAEVSIMSRKIPVVELKNVIPDRLIKGSSSFKKSDQWITCEGQIDSVSREVIWGQLDLAFQSRLDRKSNELYQQIQTANGDVLSVLFKKLGQLFGGQVNGDCFEELTNQLDQRILRRIKDRPLDAEALVFGISGLLSTAQEDDYVRGLKIRFHHLQHMFDLHQMNAVAWKYSRMRPSGFPDIRLAQFAGILANSDIQQIVSVTAIDQLLCASQPTDYWSKHYRLGRLTKSKSASLSSDLVSRLEINLIFPLKLAVEKRKGQKPDWEYYKEKYENFPVEKNKITDKWSKLGVIPRNAYDSQALIEQKNNHCYQKNCLFCSVGLNLLKN